jgi:hypothetical protein
MSANLEFCTCSYSARRGGYGPRHAKAEIGLPEHNTMRSAGIISAMPANEHILNVKFSKTLAERGSQGRTLTGSEGKI